MKLVYSFIFLGLLSCQPSASTEENQRKSIQEVQSAMDKQQADWNEGSLENYMLGYHKSDSLVFIGRRGLNYGWEQTLSNYKKSYGDRDKMGKLLFENEKIEAINGSAIWVAGRWNLLRVNDTISGSYLLVWEKINGEWKIVADHSS